MSDSKSSRSCCNRDNYYFDSASDGNWLMCLRKNDGKICKYWRKKLRKDGDLCHIQLFAQDLARQTEDALRVIKFNNRFQKNLIYL